MADIQQTIRPLTNRTDLMYSLFVSGLLCAVRQPLYRRAITVFDRSPTREPWMKWFNSTKSGRNRAARLSWEMTVLRGKKWPSDVQRSSLRISLEKVDTSS